MSEINDNNILNHDEAINGDRVNRVNIRWYERFNFVSGFIFFAALVVLLLHWWIANYFPAPIAKSFPNAVLEELGMAGLIALILNLSIEWVNRRRHQYQQENLLEKLDRKHIEATSELLRRSEEQQKETARNLLVDVDTALFNRVYKRNIDESVFQQIEKHLLRSDIMRRESVASFILRPFDQDPNLVLVEYVNKYRVFNVTDKLINADIVKAIIDVTPKYSQHCKFEEVTIGDEKISKSQLDAITSRDDVKNLISLSINRSVPPNDSIFVSIEYTKLVPSDYVEVVITTVPMDCFTVIVNDPNELFTVQAVSLHPENECLKTPDKQRVWKQWDIENAILPGQGIALLWHRSDSPTRTVGQ